MAASVAEAARGDGVVSAKALAGEAGGKDVIPRCFGGFCNFPCDEAALICAVADVEPGEHTEASSLLTAAGDECEKAVILCCFGGFRGVVLSSRVATSEAGELADDDDEDEEDDDSTSAGKGRFLTGVVAIAALHAGDAASTKTPFAFVACTTALGVDEASLEAATPFL